MTRPTEELFDELSGLCGILPEYYDLRGQRHVLPAGTKAAILRAMGIELTPEALQEIKQRPWNRLIEPVMVTSVNRQPITVPIHFELAEGREKDVFIHCSLRDENDCKEELTITGIVPSEVNYINGRRYIRAMLKVACRKDIGYYDFDVLCNTPSGKLKGSMRLIVTPDACYCPVRRTWGISLNLYSLRPEKDWGVGDLSCLKKFVERLYRLGGGFIGINPLHAIPNQRPYGISPYSPISRLFRNFIYIDMEAIPWGVSDPSQKEVSDPSQFIDYEGVASVKEKALRASFPVFYREHFFKDSPYGTEFKDYIRKAGKSLELFATFMAIGKGQGGIYDWRLWPETMRDHQAPACNKFRRTHKKEVLFYQYVQWLIERSLKEVSQRAKALGMPIGLYHDLAVGPAKGSSESWGQPNVFAQGISVGAPPDDFSPMGQDWGVVAFLPESLHELGYEPFIEIIRENLRYGGALRIDHAAGLFRLFWIPDGMSPGEGAYVQYPHEDLLRIIALESVRARAVIIAEDLGTVPEGARETLRRFGMLSYRLFYFERKWPLREFLPPSDYPEMALAGVTTHDLPTLYGWWSGRDIEVRHALGLYPDEAMWLGEASQRESDKELVMDALRQVPPLEPPARMTPELCLSVYRFLSLTPCLLVSVSLDDILGVFDQQNMPGTVDAYPNWSRRCLLTVGEIFTDMRVKTIAKMLKIS